MTLFKVSNQIKITVFSGHYTVLISTSWPLQAPWFDSSDSYNIMEQKIQNIQLFLLPFAGGNCYSFDFFKQKISAINIDYHVLELTGRGQRFGEALITNRKEAVADYLSQIRKKRNGQPYIIYGHSMGASLGLLLTKEMENRFDPPLWFIATGNPGPGITVPDETLKNPNQKKYLLDEEDFKKMLKNLGGIPEEILTNQELYDFFSPILRADFQVLEEKEDKDDYACINTPIYAIMGSEESKSAQINNWKNFTRSEVKVQIMHGNHFFIYDHPDALADIILTCCQKSELQNMVI